MKNNNEKKVTYVKKHRTQSNKNYDSKNDFESEVARGG